jgi:thioredoxin reductase/2-polyprenyl-3-methyl-5-hydroxy-6-metoxy-1,4-benzoquinol methylase
MYDVIVVGGSYAGMAAALQLARGRRNVCVIDAGQRRNRFASTAHGVLGQDGIAPSEIAGNAKEQLLRYPTVTWRDGTVIRAEDAGDAFVVRTEQEEIVVARRLVLATGVTDELPAIPGLRERWGKSIFHCPYCHGYELDRGPLGVLATGEASLHQALLIPEWGPTTFFTNGIVEPDDDQQQQLQARSVTVERELVTEITGNRATVQLQDGRVVALAGLFLASRVHAASPLAEQLGCAFVDGPLGQYVQTDETKETSVARVFACGDTARAAGNVTFAIADGAMAGLGAHRSLVFGDLVQPVPHAQANHNHHNHHGHDTHHGHHSGHHHAFTGIERWLQALENPERDTSQRPDEVIANLGLQPNDIVVDVGAGTGYFAIRIARAYPQVRVIAADAQQEMIDYLQSQSKERNLTNLEPVMIDPGRPELPVRANLALLVNTLHHIDERGVYLKHLNKSMAPGARIAIIDYTIEAPEGPPADHRIPAEEVCDDLKQAGYALELDLKFLPNQYFLIFKQA